jgi:hypothetical protein
VTVKLPEAELPAASSARQATVVARTGKVAPEAGAQVTGTEPSTSSVALAPKDTAAPSGPLAGAVVSAGRLRTGAVVSGAV